jgi:hypothetical protein
MAVAVGAAGGTSGDNAVADRAPRDGNGPQRIDTGRGEPDLARTPFDRAVAGDAAGRSPGPHPSGPTPSAGMAPGPEPPGSVQPGPGRGPAPPRASPRARP